MSLIVITADIIRAIGPQAREPAMLANFMTARFPLYGVSTGRRAAAFLAQTAHESGGFRAFVENLNYSAAGLAATWPRHFAEQNARGIVRDVNNRPVPNNTARKMERQPERIANRVYSNRMGNGDEASGDGWRFRGRGLIQTTGRANYTRLAEDTGRALADLPAWLETPAGAVESALWFWQTNNLNRYADAWDVAGLTRAINGGENGLADRKRLHARAAELLNIEL